MVYSEEDFDKLVVGLTEYETAGAITQATVDKHLAEFIFITEAALNMRNDGFFSDGTWAGIEGGALALIRTPGGRQWWSYSEKFIGSEIVEHLNMRLTQVPDDAMTFLEFTPSMKNRLAELGSS